MKNFTTEVMVVDLTPLRTGHDDGQASVNRLLVQLEYQSMYSVSRRDKESVES